MNILIFEYITGGGLVGAPLPSSLVTEGDMMLNSVASDLQELADTHVFALRDYRLRHKKISANDIIVKSGHSHVGKIEELAGKVDALLIIAPETNYLLASLCERYAQQEFTLLNSDIKSIKLTSNKYDTYKYLQAFDIPQIPTCLSNAKEDMHAERFVIKPVDGAGCENLSLLYSQSDLERVLARRASEQLIVQPFVPGMHASLSLLCWGGECLLLSCNEQCFIERGSGLILEKCKVNVFQRQKFKPFSNRLIRALPGLRGYIGVDILVTENGTVLVEINPRLTTSYVGLKSALGINPAGLMLDCFTHQRLPVLQPTSNNQVTVTPEAARAA